jgi:uncharacterized SAM-binding protein YcdF (DUF218 family)
MILPMNNRKFRWPHWVVMLLLVLIVVAGLGRWVFMNLGNWLVVADPLQPAQAIVVLSGGAPFRAMGAADLYRQGWAPEVWITTGYETGAGEAFARLGIPYTQESVYSWLVLEKMGVPAEAVHVLPTPIHNTRDEVEVVAAMLRQVKGSAVIFVTSPLHTRRARAIWRNQVGDHPQVIVRYESYQGSDPARWWRTTGDADAVVHEALGLLNARLGFFVKPGH